MASLSQDLPETVLLSLLEADHKSFHKIARGETKKNYSGPQCIFYFSSSSSGTGIYEPTSCRVVAAVFLKTKTGTIISTRPLPISDTVECT